MMPVAHCTEVAQQIDVMGHEHHFERTPAMCALPPIAPNRYIATSDVQGHMRK